MNENVQKSGPGGYERMTRVDSWLEKYRVEFYISEEDGKRRFVVKAGKHTPVAEEWLVVFDTASELYDWMTKYQEAAFSAERAG